MKILMNVSIWILLALFTQGAMAATMRCGSQLIDDGSKDPMTKDQVQSACGEPSSREGNQWIYKQQGRITKVISFDTEGRLQGITEQAVEESTGIVTP